MPVFYSRASGRVEPTEKQIMYQQSENLDTFLLYVLDEWKKHHSAIKGNPDYDAEALFVQIHKKQADFADFTEVWLSQTDYRVFELFLYA